MSGTRAAPAAWRLQDAVTADAVSLALLTIVSALPYLFQLGFYSDDWGLLAGFSERGTSIATIVGQDFVERPIQGVYLFLLFKLFGLDPLGYHIVNALVLAASSVLLFLILIRIGRGRTASFATALLFIMLPHLSTARVWYAAFQIPLALLFSLVSMHCQLSFARSGTIGWLAAAIASAVLSIAAYEIFVPLIAGFAVAVAWINRRRKRQAWILTAVVVATALAGVVYKLAISGRTGAVGDPNRYLLGVRQLFRLDYDWRVDSSLNIIAAPRAYFWAPVQGWLRGARALVGGGAAIAVIVSASLIAAVAWWRLRIRKSIEEPVSAEALLQIGLATFLLGNATFLIVPAVVFTPTGMGNRVHVAAAIGVAMIFVALVAVAARAGGERHRREVFAILIAVVSAIAFVRLATIQRYWAEAPALQERVLNAARVDLRDLPARSTVILDGVCPYHGPAVVFEEAWDFGGALTLALGRTMRGDTVSPRMSLTPKGLETSIYKEPSFYPYGPDLYVYNPARHLLFRLTDPRVAARYFGTREPSHCPRGFVARGVEV